MAKNVFKATDQQIEDLYKALKGGSPLLLALQYAGISRATYFYWVAVASVVEQAKSQEELEDVEELLHSGISIQQVRDLSESMASSKRTSVGAFIEPSAESVLAYKNDRKFKRFANKCFEVISECNKIRSGLTLVHLNNICASVDKGKRINPSGSMWFLERTMPDYFGRAADKDISKNDDQVLVESVRVEYVEPDSDETKKRVADMEADLLAKINGEGQA